MSTAGEMESPASCSTSERSTRRSPVSRLISTSVQAAPKVLYVSFLDSPAAVTQQILNHTIAKVLPREVVLEEADVHTSSLRHSRL